MKNIIYFIISLVVAVLQVPLPAQAAGVVTVSVSDRYETIKISLPTVHPNKVFTINQPERLVVDVPALAGKPDLGLPASYKGELITSIRYGLFNPDTSRIVFDLSQPVKIIEQSEDNGLVIVIGPMQESRKTMASTGKADKKPKNIAPKADKSVKTIKLARPMVVIDAGHGGVDPGTSGPKGTLEKDVVLDYAKALAAKLQKSGKYRVKLTRSDDRFIMLRKRVEIAREAGGAIFISLHADSAPNDLARGLSVYTVSEQASDMEAEALAARENKSDVIAGMNLSDEREDVADILISLAQRETKNSSAALADFLVARLSSNVKLLENTHRFAGFAVLKAPDIPSVLIEIGFLSHAAEEKLLKSKSYRENVVSGIAGGIDAYFQQKNNE